MNYITKRLKDRNFLVLLGSDIVLLFLAFYLSVLLRYEFVVPPEIILLWSWKTCIAFLIIKIASFRIFCLYRGMWRYTSIWDMVNVFKANILASLLIVIGVATVFGFQGISRAVFVLDLFICAVLIGSSRLGIRMFFSHIFHAIKTGHEKNTQKFVLLIGAGDTGQTILRQTLQQPKEGIDVVGFLDDNPNKLGARLHGVPVIGSVADLENVVTQFDEILICTPSANREQMRTIIEECKKTDKPFKTLPSISELVHGNVSISQFREVSLVDLLGREEISLDESSINEFIHGKRVLITGAGGSIGSELVRQCMKFEPAVLVMLDISELNLFEIDREIMEQKSPILFKPILSDIRDPSVLNQVFEEFEPQVVLHAAAYKHVPMQEYFPWEAVKTNVFGTTNLAKISVRHHVEKFVLVSTDKAVKPVNVMGATKRLAEMIVQSANRENNTEFMAVRFGNVLGSSGSVIPIFQDQIKNGGPVTVTDPDMERYFMSIPEASQLILQAGAMGMGGEVFILDMGEPIKILDLAYELIRLSGYEPELDIPISFIGIRPGEKKVEELVLDSEQLDQTRHEKILVLKDGGMTDELLAAIKPGLKDLELDLSLHSANQIRTKLSQLLPEYEPDLSSKEPVYLRIKAQA